MYNNLLINNIMKKVLLSLLVFAASVTAMAADYSALVQLKITSGDTYNSTLTLGEGFASTTTGVLYEEGGVTIALYANYESKKCESLTVTGTLGNLPLGFKATQSTSYTITCEYAEGNALYLKNGENEPVQIATTMEPVVVNIEDAQKGTFVEGVLALVIPTPPAAYTRDVTGGQWGTICYPASITEVQGGVLYSLTYTDGTQVFAEVATLPTTAGQAYVFKADDDATQLVMPYTGDDASVQTTHGLVGTFEDITVPAGAYGILNNVVVEIAEGNALKAYRAYIKMEDLISDNAPKRGRAIFMIQNATTGLDGAAINGMKNGKYIMNGRFMIVKDGKTTNVLGL